MKQREIKFKCWDKTTKTFVQFSMNERGMVYDLPQSDCDVVILQYTGLKDKNGKEIYEGDVVQALYEWGTYDGDACFEHSTIHKGEVVFLGGEWRVKDQFTGLYRWDKDSLEVIGNIYEKQHLNPQESTKDK